MKVFVTGGNGCVGAYTVERLTGRGRTLRLLIYLGRPTAQKAALRLSDTWRAS